MREKWQRNERVNPQPFPPDRPRTSERVRASREEMYVFRMDKEGEMYVFCMDNEGEMAQGDWHPENERVNRITLPTTGFIVEWMC